MNEWAHRAPFSIFVFNLLDENSFNKKCGEDNTSSQLEKDIVIQDSKVRLMQINNYTSSADRAIAMIPELVDKLTELTEAKKKDSTPAEE